MVSVVGSPGNLADFNIYFSLLQPTPHRTGQSALITSRLSCNSPPPSDLPLSRVLLIKLGFVFQRSECLKLHTTSDWTLPPQGV